MIKHELIFICGGVLATDSFWEMPWTSFKKVQERERVILASRAAAGWKLFAYSVS